VGERGKHQDRDRTLRHDVLDGGHTVHHRHFEIHGDDIGPQFCSFFHSFTAIAGDTDDLQLGVLPNNVFQPQLKEIGIIDDQHPQWHEQYSTTSDCVTASVALKKVVGYQRDLIVSPGTGTARIAPQQSGHIEDQGDGAVTGNGCTGHTRRAVKHLAQWLDHHLFLTDQLIHHKTDTTGTDTDDNNVSFVLQTFALCAFDEPLFQMEQRYGLITDGDAFLTVHHVALAQIHMENFVHVGQRQSECLLAEHDHQGRHDREGQRHFDNQASALANGRLDFNTAVELGNLGLYHIHADTTAGHIGNFFLGREARCKDQVERFGVRQAIGGIFVKHASLDCDATQFHGVHTGTIVGDGQENMIALLL